MKNYTITLEEHEYDYVKKQLKGYVRMLIQADMELGGKKQVFVSGEPPTKVYTRQTVNTHSPKQIDPINSCNKCGHILTAGKCTNPECGK